MNTEQSSVPEQTSITPSAKGAAMLDTMFHNGQDVTSMEQFKALKVENPTPEHPSKAVASTYFPPEPTHDHNVEHNQSLRHQAQYGVEQRINQPRR